jgi:hypothetical protein
MRLLYRFDGWLVFARVIALFMFLWLYVRLHILCTQLVICLLSHFIHIWYLGWPWSEYAHIIPISRMVDIYGSHIPFHVCLTTRPFAHLVYATSHLSFVAFYSYLVSWLAIIWACAYYTDFTDGWFLREWPYVRSHILCTQLVICLLSHFIHIWYLGWLRSEYEHIIQISRMVDFCESHSPFHVFLTICPFAHLVYATSHLSFVTFYSYLASWLAMIWAWAYYTDFTDGWFLRES